jgi:surface antigen
MRSSLPGAVICALVLGLAGCQTAARKPAIFYDAQGAPEGSFASGGSGDPATGSFGGIVIGGITSSEIARSLSETDLQRAAQAEHFALETAEPGRAQLWSNPTTNTGGTIVVGATYDINRSQCRDYTHTVTTAEGERVVRATACRQPNGTWRSVSS